MKKLTYYNNLEKGTLQQIKKCKFSSKDSKIKSNLMIKALKVRIIGII